MNRTPALRVTRRIIQFPETKEDIEIATFQSDDGRSRRVEVVFRPVMNVYDALMTLVHPHLLPGDDAFNLVISLDGQLSITRIPSVNKVLQYDQETLHYTFNAAQVKQFRALLIKHIGTLLNLFANYFTQASHTASNKPDFNLSMNNVLRLTAGANVKYLEDILGMYIAVGGQTYFDVVGSIIMSGSYTLSSVLLHCFNQRRHGAVLRGKELLVTAAVRTTANPQDRMLKGEYYFSAGLSLIYSRQFRVRLNQSSFDSKTSMNDYGKVVLVDDEEVFEDEALPSTPTGSKMNHVEARTPWRKFFLKGAAMRVRKIATAFEGWQQDIQVAAGLKNCSDTSPSCLIDVLHLFEIPTVASIVEPVDPHVNLDIVQQFVDYLSTIEEFECFEVGSLCLKNLARMLCIFEAMESEGVSGSLCDEMIAVANPHKAIEDFVMSFKTSF